MSVDSDKAPPVAQWPDASLWPTEDTHPLDAFRFYRDALGWRCFPTLSEADIAERAIRAITAAVDDYRLDHQQDPPDDVMEVIREYAHAEAQKRAKGICPFVRMADYPTAASITDEVGRRWWGAKSTVYMRGIAVVPSQSAAGFPVVLSDVDPRHGGDLDGPWGRPLGGLQSVTPGGGLHTLLLATGHERNSGGRTAVAPGVDVIARGTPIRVPSGRSSPGRWWVSLERPRPAPSELCEVRRPVAPVRKDRPPREREPGEEEWEDSGGYATSILTTEIADDVGHRNAGAGPIIGILARPRGCPDDFVRACLDLLAEEMAGRDQPSAAVVEEAQRWHHMLTRGPRDAEFAGNVLAAWIRVRDMSRVPWSEEQARRIARSLWKTCDHREDGLAGAEDAGYGPATDDVPTDIAGAAVDLQAVAFALQAAPLPPPPLAQPSMTDPPLASHYILDGPTEAERAAALAATRDAIAGIADGAPVGPPRLVGAPPRVDPFRLFRSLRRSYPREAFEEDCRRQPIDLTRLGWFMDFNRGIPEGMAPPPAAGEQARLGQTDPAAAGLFGHGIGTWLAEAVGGLVPGDFKAFGAAGAKAGKTYFVGQFVEGLAFCSACRLMGLKGYESAPIVMARWITEMPKDGELNLRFMARHLGFDAKTITQGVMAERMVAQAAERDRFAPAEYVARARRFYETYEDARYPSGAVLDLIEEIDLSALPPARGQGRMREDPRGGPSLVGHVADAVQAHRRRFAETFGVPESDVVPLVVWDPAQRFAGDDSADARSAIDALFRAVLERICKRSGGVHGIALCTSDTTKTAAKELTLQDFQTREGRAVAADVFAGAQSIMHIADTVVALMAEPPTARSLTTTMWARVLQGRTGAPPESFPFLWEMHCGRFRAQAPGKPRESAPRINDIPDFGRA